ncbi:ZN785 protein, partial [Copsychus sechellarum]|nr:ZN785 protein [Copsychus sechellarum]
MEPCVALDPRQRALYRDMMQESYGTLMAPEFPVPKPDLLSYLDHEEAATALDLQVSRDTPAAEHGAGAGAGAGQEEPAEEKPSTDKEHPEPPVSGDETQAAHTCGDCGKIFSPKSAPVKHRKIHGGDHQHACPACGAAFTQRCDLAGERPRGCP